MSSIFDSAGFNQRLFFPRADSSTAPRHAQDRFVSVGGERLHLRWHRRLEVAPTLLLFHGNGEVVSDYDDQATRFADAGANLAVVDYRGYGESSGIPTLRSMIADAREVARVVASESARLVIMGRSLGSACAAAVYQDPPASVCSFIWESGFIDLVALIRRRGLTPPDSFSEAELGVFDSSRKLRRGRHPLLILHGDQDDLISPTEAQRALAIAGAPQKTLQLIAGRGHNDLSLAPEYWQAIARFVAAHARAS